MDMLSDKSTRWEFSVNDLIEVLSENKKRHVKEYKKAFSGYQKALEKELKNKVQALKKEGGVDVRITLSKPQSHEEDYDRILEVLDFTVAETVSLTLSEFDKYVRDKWDWKGNFVAASAPYLG